MNFRNNSKELVKYIKEFKNKRVAVIGDIIADKFIRGKVSRISPEAPVPVVNVQREDYMPGGSANVMCNLLSLDAKVDLFGVIGDDYVGKQLLSQLQNNNRVDISGVVLDDSRRTSLKTRVIAGTQQLVRIDNEDISKIQDGVFQKIINQFESKINEFDAIIISDYFKGVVTKELITKVNYLAKDIPVFVDPKVNNFKHYNNVFMVTPNALEACSFVQMHGDSQREVIEAAGREIFKRLTCKHLLITRGEAGMLLFENKDLVVDIPTEAKEVIDVSGAGDTVIAVMALGVASGATLKECAFLANIAAGIVVGKLGTASISHQELIQNLL